MLPVARLVTVAVPEEGQRGQRVPRGTTTMNDNECLARGWHVAPMSHA